MGNEWDGKTDCRAAAVNLEARVRDLEEEARTSSKSRQGLHRQMSELDKKMDKMLDKMDAKTLECAAHKTQTALAIKSLEAAEDKIDDVSDEQVWVRRFAVSGLVAAVLSLLSVIWSMVPH